MNTIFMNSENSKISEPHVLILKLTDNLYLRRDEKSIALSNLSIYYTWKNIKTHTITKNLKYQLQHGMLKIWTSDALYFISNIQDYFEYILKEHGEIIDKPSAKIYVNKIENRIIFRIKKGYGLELLTSETMKLLGSAENKITKSKIG